MELIYWFMIGFGVGMFIVGVALEVLDNRWTP